LSPASRTGIALRLSLFYFAVFLFVGVGLPFWPAWLASRGLGPAEIGLLLSLNAWVKLVGNPLIAHFADRSGEARRPLILVTVGSLLAFALFAVVDGFWAFLLVTILSGLCLSALTPLGDSLTMRLAASEGLDYGRIRLWGSLSFILAGAGAGWLLAGRSTELILLLILIALVLTLAACVLLPEQRGAVAHGGLAGWRSLFGDRRFLWFLAAAGLIQASHAVLYGFSTLHWLAAGHDKDTIGALWAIGVVAEVLLFAAGGRIIALLGPIGLLLVGGLAGVLRWTLAAWFTTLPVLVIVQLLHGLTFGGTHLAAMYFLVRQVPPGLAATAQGLYGAIAWGAVFGLAMLAAGALYAAVGGGAFFAMAAMSLVGSTAAIFLMPGDRR
ncbi:MAG: MFS transporter, partial [Dongiaceae bacterium]